MSLATMDPETYGYLGKRQPVTSHVCLCTPFLSLSLEIKGRMANIERSTVVLGTMSRNEARLELGAAGTAIYILFCK